MFGGCSQRGKDVNFIGSSLKEFSQDEVREYVKVMAYKQIVDLSSREVGANMLT